MERETTLMRCKEGWTGQLVVGEVYRIAQFSGGRDGGLCDVYTKDGDYISWFSRKRFEPIALDPMEEYKKGMGLIGHEAALEYETGTVTDATLLMDIRQLNRAYVTPAIKEDFDRDGFCVVLVIRLDKLKLTSYIPLSAYSAPPKSKDLTLNEQYNASVYVDKVVVGCQTFPAQTLYDLVALHKELLEANNIKH
jgi:hypothetical protein